MPNRVLLLACECLVIIAVLGRILIRKNFYMTVTTGRGTNALSADLESRMISLLYGKHPDSKNGRGHEAALARACRKKRTFHGRGSPRDPQTRPDRNQLR